MKKQLNNAIGLNPLAFLFAVAVALPGFEGYLLSAAAFSI